MTEHYSPAQDRVITSAVASFVQKKVAEASISGLAVGAVRLRAEPDGQPLVEVQAWGKKTEEGDALTPDVRTYRYTR